MIRKEKGRVDVYGDRFRARAHQLTPRLLQVARYIHDNREAVMEQTAMEIATLLKTSDATVVRAIQALGFAGLVLGIWPNIVPPSLSIWDAASPPSSQGFLLAGMVVLVPTILGYTYWSYSVFRGKISADEGYH